MKENDKKFKYIIIGLFILAFIIRLIYIIKIPYNINQHDITGKYGGIAYIFNIFNEGKLPENYIDQNYQQPFNALLSAGFMGLISIFTKDVYIFLESLQVLQLIISMILMYLIYLICKEIKLKEYTKYLIMVIAAFHPLLIILSGSINNDNLSLTLMVSIIYFLIRWNKKSNLKNTIILAILTGLCVLTKLSGAMMAIPISYIFISKLLRETNKISNKYIDDKDNEIRKIKVKEVIKKYLILYSIFACISLPIGMWYSFRNNIKFGQPILYVQDNINEKLYVGDESVFKRFFPLSEDLIYMYCRSGLEKNIPAYLIKSSIYGEFNFRTDYIGNLIYSTTIILNISIIVITIIGFIKNIKRLKEKKKIKRRYCFKNILFLLLIFNIICYLSLNIKIPFTCSMDFRYLLILLFIGAFFVGMEIEETKSIIKKKMLYKNYLFLNVLLFLLTNYIILY